MDSSDTRIGVIGLGAMGSRMARRLLEAGHDVAVWNRTGDKASPLADAGADVAESPGELARDRDVVMTMLSDPDALLAVADGGSGIARNLAPSSVWVEMSTVGPSAITELMRLLDDDSRLLEAPVLGSLSEVENGTLKIFIGGPQSLADRLKPLLSHLGTPMYVGPRGSGAAAKLVANLTLVGTIGVLGEAIALGEGLSLPLETTFAILGATPLAAQAERRKPAVASGDYPPRFSLALARKDAHLIEEAASERGLRFPVASAAAHWLDEAAQAGLEQADYSAVLGYIRSRAAGASGDTTRSGDEVA